MEEDISNKTIVVLVVLTVLVSLLSTMVVINEVSNLKVEPRVQTVQPSNTGQISLEITEPPETAQANGHVVLEITPRN